MYWPKSRRRVLLLRCHIHDPGVVCLTFTSVKAAPESGDWSGCRRTWRLCFISTYLEVCCKFKKNRNYLGYILLGLSEMNHGLFVLVLNSLYSTEQFTFFLSLSVLLPACPPLRAAWTLKRSLSEWSPVSPDPAGFTSSLPPCVEFLVDPHNMGVFVFSPFLPSVSHPSLPSSGSAPDL